jgi:hypothetical protein
MNDGFWVSLATDVATIVFLLGLFAFMAKLITELWLGFNEY